MEKKKRDETPGTRYEASYDQKDGETARKGKKGCERRMGVDRRKFNDAKIERGTSEKPINAWMRERRGPRSALKRKVS